MAIWGWSYGGFTAGMALAQDNKHVLKCAASVAPVTDWTYYGMITMATALSRSMFRMIFQFLILSRRHNLYRTLHGITVQRGQCRRL